MDLHYFLGDADSGLCDRYVLYFSPTFISHFSTPESNLLESFQLSRVERPVILQAEEDEIDAFRRLMDEMIVYERSSNAEPPHYHMLSRIQRHSVHKVFAGAISFTCKPSVLQNLRLQAGGTGQASGPDGHGNL